MPDDLKLTCTNADLWLATQPADPDKRPYGALYAILKVPMTVLAVRNGSTLRRKVEEALKDIDAARVALCEQNGTKTDDATNYTITNPEGWQTGWLALMAESVTLTGVRALRISEFAQGSFVAEEDVTRCGLLLTD